MTGPPLLELREVSARYVPSRMTVRGVTLGLHSGESVGLVGESGSGKTTLGNCIAGLMPLTAGEIRYEGTLASSARQRPAFPRVRGVQAVYQDPQEALNPRRSVGSLITEVLRVHRMVPRSEVACCCSGPAGPDGPGRQRQATPAQGALWRHVPAGRDRPGPGVRAPCPGGGRDCLGAGRVGPGPGAQPPRPAPRADRLRDSADHARPRGREPVRQRLAVMCDGEIVETGPTADVLARPRHAYTASLINALPRLEKGAWA